MSFLSPIWLLGLLPWAGLAAWLLVGQPPGVEVPFLRLWEFPVAAPRAHRKLSLPPLAIWLVLIGLLLALLAAARPAIHRAGGGDEPVASIIIDRGMTMSAQTPQGLRFRQAFAEAIPELRARLGGGAIRLVPVPGEASYPGSIYQCGSVVAGLGPTALDTHQMLNETVASEAAGGRPVIVVSDQPLAGKRANVVQVPPTGVVRDVGIVSLSARKSPKPQAMVRVRNRSTTKSATLIVQSEGASAQQSIELPSEGNDRDYFLDLPRLGATVSARLDVKDDWVADDEAWLVREGNSPRIEPRASVSPELTRMIEVYQKSRPAGDGSERLVLVTDPAQLPNRERGVIVAPAREAAPSGPLRVQPHGVTSHVKWGALPGPVRIAGDPPAGWTTVVSIGGKALVAVRPDGVPQVWVGFDSADWSRTSDFVIFWTNVFDWAGGGGETFLSHPLSQWSAEWKQVEPAPAPAGQWPGLYKRSDGALRAFSAGPVKFDAIPATDWPARLSAVPARVGRREISMVLLILAIGCLGASAAVWRRVRKTVQVPEIRQGSGSHASA